MKVVISTVGTSVLTNNPKYRDRAKELQDKSGDDLQLYQNHFSRLADEISNDILRSPFQPESLSAETHSLAKIKVEEMDCLVFLTSDTLDGMLCGEILKRVCQKNWGVKAESRRINGLQVHDAKKFRFQAITSLVEVVSFYTVRYRPAGYKFVLNPTGGFKALVPYITLLGLLEGISVKYIYERSKTLIELPSAPLSMDIQPLKELGKAAHLMADDLIKEEELVKETGLSAYELRQKYKDILAWEDGYVTLSALARVIYHRELSRNGTDELRYSKKLLKKLKDEHDLRHKMEPIFERMRYPLYRQHHLHNEVKGDGVDLDCFKQGDTSERIFYFVEGDTVFLCDIYKHDEYVRLINKEEVLLKEKYIHDFD